MPLQAPLPPHSWFVCTVMLYYINVLAYGILVHGVLSHCVSLRILISLVPSPELIPLRPIRPLQPETVDNELNDTGPLAHRALADVATRQLFWDRTKDRVPKHIARKGRVLGRKRVQVHERVHGREDVRRCRR